MTRALAGLVGMICIGSAVARAEVRPRAAVLEVSIYGTAAPELRGQLERSLAAGLTAGGFDVVGREAVSARLRGQPDLVGCLTTTCLERIGALLGVERFVRGRVEAQGAAYAVRLELLSGERVVRSVERSCPVCTFGEANELIKLAGSELGPKNPNLVSVDVQTDPPGLPVTVDTEPRGRAPFETSLPPGRHVFRLVIDGKESPDVFIDVSPTQDGKPFPVTLRPPAPPPTAPPIVPVDDGTEVRPRWAVWKVAAIGAGGAFLLTGILLFAIDGDEVDCADGRPCRLLRETTALAVTSTLVGVGLLGTGGWMFYDDLKRQNHPRAALVPRPGGAMVVWGGSF